MNQCIPTADKSDLGSLIACHIEPFTAELKATGYALGTLGLKRAALRDFADWWRTKVHRAAVLDEAEVLKFLRRSPRPGQTQQSVEAAALRGFLEYLHRHRLIQASPPLQDESDEVSLERRYADFLRHEKGLAELSLRVYLPPARDLLQYLKRKHGANGVGKLDAPLLRAYLLGRARGKSSETVRLLTISLRSFLRFLHGCGTLRSDLSIAIPSVQRWAQPNIPRRLTPKEVTRILQAPDRTTSTGRRDYAIMLLLARLGLRASEIIALELEDIQWRTGEIRICGKGRQFDLLPLPAEVGAAIARYVQLDRGVRPTRRVFVRTIAPRVPFSGPASVGHIVRDHMKRAGVDRPAGIAAHLFRHTLASRMLQKGASLWDISEALRHRSYSSTEIYAKIDLRSLGEVVRPWPTTGGVR